MNLRRLSSLSGLLLIATGANAEVFSNPARTYFFEMPRPWYLAHPDFMLMSATGASLSESDLPQGPQSLERISKTAGMIACIGADYSTTKERFELEGENWKGLVTVFVEPARTNRQPRHVLQLVAQHGKNFRLFYLAVPSREWLSDGAQSRKLLGALRFR
ncbi:MAG: hypothetical protein ACT4PZ_05195 [Panacagrimonas sp.]